MLNEAKTIRTKQHARFVHAAAGMGIMPVFSHCSAIVYWGVSPPPDCRIDDALHLSYPNRSARRRIAGTRAHMWASRFDTSDLADFRVASPAMALAQVSQHCSEETIAVIAGSFACRDKRRRVATIDEIIAYFLANKGFRGRAKCLAIAPFLMANADSPPEARLVVLLMRDGLGRPVVNHQIIIDSGEYCFLDIAYPEFKVGIEFQGAYHANPAQMRADIARLNKLRMLGWEIIQVTILDLANEQAKARILNVIRAVIERQRAVLHLARTIIR